MTPQPSHPSWADPSAVARVVVTVLSVLAVVGVLYLLRQPLTWFFLAAFLAIAVSGPVAFFSRRMPRGFRDRAHVPAALPRPDCAAAGDRAERGAWGGGARRRRPALRRVGREVGLGQRLVARPRGPVPDPLKLQAKLQDLPALMGGIASWLGDLGLGVVNSGFAMVNIVLMSMFLVGGGPGGRAP